MTPSPCRRATVLATFCAALLAGCASLPAMDARAPFDSARLRDVDHAIAADIAARKLPGAVYRLERSGVVYEQAFGQFTYEPGSAKVTPDTVFDAASLTKVLATAPSVLLLAEDGKLLLDAPLVRYFPECANGGKEAITVRQLLTHTSGLPAGLPARPGWQGGAAALTLACSQTLTHTPGSFFRYSDINYILLGLLVERASGMPLERFAQERLFRLLGMRDTGYLPLARRPAGAIAPTQRAPGVEGDAALHGDLAPGQLLQGVVHDPTVRRMGGVAGSAGVFTTARDVARFARMLVGEGTLEGTRVLSKDSVRLLTSVQTPPGLAMRGMGMDIDSPYAQRPRGSVFPVGSYGHTGFTGCILWVDPQSRTFYVFLSNRVYPDDKSNVLALYTRLGTLSAQAAQVPSATTAPAAATALATPP
ncbi:serine hydrolase domain-containing protein [Massilia yuzhufengensis]|uniref:CubicO group peptidase, beta-lactamase class C family n=1 Tax=Massilia yuzhufengensis TaxID=1164594 RepID=A0A1I1UE65_9BURK|nr:serine hydrolase domain-containing protein [Massilia yuzhufengensis]SFD69136.1 CubicO group peptidase, beta-lactamase class C family [Massilia yuzhufengensis]